MAKKEKSSRYYVTITMKNFVDVKTIWEGTVRQIENKCWKEYNKGALAVELELITFLNFQYYIE